MQCQGLRQEMGFGVEWLGGFLGRALLSLYRNSNPRGKEGARHTWAPSARSREVRLRRPLTALSTCSRRAPHGWDALVNRAWPCRIDSESRARPCQTSRACCWT